MMQAGANMLMVGGAGFIGSHRVKRPLARRRSGSGACALTWSSGFDDGHSNLRIGGCRLTYSQVRVGQRTRRHDAYACGKSGLCATSHKNPSGSVK